MSDRLKMTASEEAAFTEAFRRSQRRVSDGAAVTAPDIRFLGYIFDTRGAPADTIKPCRFEPQDTQAENELIAEKLLGWVKVLPSQDMPGSPHVHRAIWREQLTEHTWPRWHGDAGLHDLARARLDHRRVAEAMAAVEGSAEGDWMRNHAGSADRAGCAIRGPVLPAGPGAMSDDEPSVMGAGCGLPQMPSRSEAEAIWRRAYVDRMVFRGLDREDAQACCDASEVDLSESPADAADDELQYWDDDDGN